MIRRLQALWRRITTPKRDTDTEILKLYALHEEYRNGNGEQTPRAFEVWLTERLFGRYSDAHRDAVARYRAG